MQTVDSYFTTPGGGLLASKNKTISIPVNLPRVKYLTTSKHNIDDLNSDGIANKSRICAVTSCTHKMHSRNSYIRGPLVRASRSSDGIYSSSGTENESTTYTAPCNGCARKVTNVTLHIVMSIRRTIQWVEAWQGRGPILTDYPVLLPHFSC